MDCIFCKIISGEIPCKKVYEDEKTLAFLDIQPKAPGHTVVIPKKHYINILDCPKEVLAAVIYTVQRVAKKYTAVNVINNSGAKAGQEVFHLHFHVIPRASAN